MAYFVIRNTDGDTYVNEIKEEKLLEELDSGLITASSFLADLPSTDTNYWGEGRLLIKGEIVIPQAEEVVIKHKL